MSMTAAGVAKLIEECGELQQVLAKRLAYWTTDEHPDGSNLRTRMMEELGDVLAAIDYVVENLILDAGTIWQRKQDKLRLYRHWGMTLDNNQGIDAV